MRELSREMRYCRSQMSDDDSSQVTSNFLPSFVLHVTLPESPTASKENLLDQGCPGSLSLAYKTRYMKYDPNVLPIY